MHTARVRVAIARRSPPSYPWRPERAQPGVSKTAPHYIGEPEGGSPPRHSRAPLPRSGHLRFALVHFASEAGKFHLKTPGDTHFETLIKRPAVDIWWA